MFQTKPIEFGNTTHTKKVIQIAMKNRFYHYDIMREMAQPEGLCGFFILQDFQAVGFAIGEFYEPEHRLSIIFLLIEPEYRNKGYGTNSVKLFESMPGVKQVVIDTGNKRMKFYERLGYKWATINYSNGSAMEYHKCV